MATLSKHSAATAPVVVSIDCTGLSALSASIVEPRTTKNGSGKGWWALWVGSGAWQSLWTR